MAILPIDPMWTPLRRRVTNSNGALDIAGSEFSGTTEIISEPVPLASSGPGQVGTHAQFIAVRGMAISAVAAAGPLTGAFDLRWYRTPEAKRQQRETAPSYTKTVAAGGATSAELVNNPDFAAVGNWRMGTHWSIAGGKAQTTASEITNAELWQTLTLPANTYGSVLGLNTKFLFRMDLDSIGSDGGLDVCLDGGPDDLDQYDNHQVPRELIRRYASIDTAAANFNRKVGLFDAVNKGVASQKLVIAARYPNEPAFIDAVIDNVSLRAVTPLNFCDLHSCAELGDGVCLGFLPSASYDNAYLWAWYRRFMEV